MKMTVEEIRQAVGGQLVKGDPDALVLNITTASNKLKGQDLFVPVIGENVDGHKYIADALRHGAVLSFTQEHPDMAAVEADEVLGAYYRESFETGTAFNLIYVDNTVAALQTLGRWYRKNFVDIPFIGVTGSVGKTTTREMIATALSAGLKTYSTKGNANSQVGVPITVTETDEDAQIGVLELGVSEFGEMTKISGVACVDTVAFTVIGISHIAQFKTQENILKEKLHIMDGSPDTVLLILNGDDPMLSELTEEKIHAWDIVPDKHIDIRFYGTGDNADIRGTDIHLEDGFPAFDVSFRKDSFENKKKVVLSVLGDHMVKNAICALAVADAYGVDLDAAIEALSSFSGLSGRGEILRKNSVVVINDAYNAAPQSMKAGLKVLNDMPDRGGRKIAVMADMRELGENELSYHIEVGEYIRDELPEVTDVLLLGELSKAVAEGLGDRQEVLNTRHFDTLDALMDCLKDMVKPGDTLLIKGSNSMKLGTIIDRIREME